MQEEIAKEIEETMRSKGLTLFPLSCSRPVFHSCFFVRLVPHLPRILAIDEPKNLIQEVMQIIIYIESQV
jgi:hypothetical protein